MLSPAEIVAPVLARQGHLYLHGPSLVLALESGPWVTVAEIHEDCLWLGHRSHVAAHELRPLPMRYYRDETPK